MRNFDAMLLDELEKQISNDEQIENFDDVSIPKFLLMRVNRMDAWTAVRGATAWLVLSMFGFIGVTILLSHSILSRIDMTLFGIGNIVLIVGLTALFLICMLLFLVSYDIRRFEYGTGRYNTFKVTRLDDEELMESKFLYQEINSFIPDADSEGNVSAISKLIRYFFLANFSLIFGRKDLYKEYEEFKKTGLMGGTRRRILRDETCYEPGVFYEKVVACYKDRIKEADVTMILIAFPLGFITAFTMMLFVFYAIVLQVLILWRDLGLTPIMNFIGRFDLIYALLVVIVIPLVLTGVFFIVLILNTLFAPIAFDSSMKDVMGRKWTVNRTIWAVSSFAFAFVIGVFDFIDYYNNDWENIMDDEESE